MKSRPSVIPVLVYRDGAAAIDWLTRVFGLEELFRASDDDGTVLHAELGWGHGIAIVTTDDGSLTARVGNSWIWAAVDDPDDHWRRAADAGARILIEPRSVTPDSRSYRALDLEGHQWTFIGDVPSLPAG